MPQKPMTLFRHGLSFLALSVVGLTLVACLGDLGRSSHDQAPANAEVTDMVRFTPTSFADLPGWAGDDHEAALETFRRSCARIVKADAKAPLDPKTGAGSLYGTTGDWLPACAAAQSWTGSARSYFETHFQPLAVFGTGGADGLFTGYFEPEIRASLTRTGPYQTPLLTKPDDLQRLNLGDFDPALAGQTIRGRNESGRFVPYPDRTAIEQGALDPEKLAIAWVANPVDAFFTHIQGSARLLLPDGTTRRVGFAEKNGQPYTAIGKILIDQGEIAPEQVSMQSIRAWLQANPGARESILRANKSFIFFNLLPIGNDGLGPIGAGNVALTPGRSLAIDRSIHGLGAPIWLEADLPGENGPTGRLMVAQDTGSAIKGPVRGDFFWGSGDAAGEKAGIMKAKGRFWVLVPPNLAQKTGFLP